MKYSFAFFDFSLLIDLRSNITRQLVRVVVLPLGIVFFGNLAAIAATFTVVNTNDSGSGSLRQAVADANFNSQSDVITFDNVLFSMPQTISLTSGEIVVEWDHIGGTNFDVTVIGPGSDLLTIDANNISRIFRGVSGVAHMNLSGMTLSRGRAEVGGAIFSESSIRLERLKIKNSSAVGNTSISGISGAMGGGLFADGVIIGTTFENNSAIGVIVPSSPPNPSFGGDARGGAAAGELFLVDCTFTGNIAEGADAPDVTSGFGGAGGWSYGGAVFLTFGGSVINSKFRNNLAEAGKGASVSEGTAGRGGTANGGALYFRSTPRILNAMFYQNQATGGAGGLSPSPALSGDGGDAIGGALFLATISRTANMTVVANSSTPGGGRVGGSGMGGGIYIRPGQFMILNSTVTNNIAFASIGTQSNGVGRGGGVFSAFESEPPTPLFRNNIISDNSASQGVDVYGLFVSGSNNLIRIGDSTSDIQNGINGNQVGSLNAPLNPLLGPLVDNGGNTLTRALLEGSPAINAGNNSVSNPINIQATLTVDHRNLARIFPAGGTIDVGAYELGSPAVHVPISTPDLQSNSDTGASSSDNITRSNSPSFDVANAIPGALIELLRDGHVVATTYAASFTATIADRMPPQNGSVAYKCRQTFAGIESLSGTLLVEFDQISPSVTLNQAATQADPTRLTPINFTAVYSERVSSTGLLSYQGSTANMASASQSGTSVDGITWNIGVTGISSNGQMVVVNLNSGAYFDIAGNPGSASISTDNTVILDNVRPTVTINQAIGQSDPTNILPVNFTVSFSESVSGFSVADILFAGSTADVSQAIIIISGGPSVYNVAISNVPISGTIRATIAASAAQDVLGNMSFASSSTDNSVTLVVNIPTRALFDFDGDAKSDLSIFRPNGAEWWWLKSSNGGNGAVQFGAPSDDLVPADFTGDGKTDIAFWRPETGNWFVLRSEDFSFYAFPFGATGDVPAPADYDGDGKADAAVFRESAATWYISRSSGGTDIVGFGAVGDKPVNADYDGDGKADIAIFRPNGPGGAEWWVRRSSNASVFALQFGSSTDKAVPGDFTGDGKADVAFWRPATGFWNVLRSEDFSYYAFPFGANGDIASPGDYDGDGKIDAAVFRPSSATWFANRSTAGTLIQQFGAAGDIPVPSAFVR